MTISSRILPALLVVTAFAGGLWIGHEWDEQRHNHREWRSTRMTEGQLTSPLIACVDDPSELTIGKRAAMEKDVAQLVTALRAEGRVTASAVYFRDLNNGPWFGIDERKPFIPGSLLKLPIALSVYWRAEREPGVFTHYITYDGVVPASFAALGQGTEDTLTPGTYTVHELVSFMLRDSSNAAAALLVEYQGEARLKSIFSDLGIEPPVNGGYMIDVKTYGAFFRILYNASYIDQPAAEEMLDTLTRSSFTSGIAAGVPSDVRVAHKFGTRVLDPDGTRQLHDCGIVYAPQTPYVLCIMTQGKRTADLEYVLKEISKHVYDHVAE
jgi:beta-lactamase class A